MSWSVSATFKASKVEEGIDALHVQNSSLNAAREQEAAVEAAKKAAKSILKSGALGVSEAFSITMSGHANARNRQVKGISQDVISVSVAQLYNANAPASTTS